MPILAAALLATLPLSALPLPVSGYQVYLVGELHGVQETEKIFMHYLARLGVRDVAIEEDAVYKREAQAYVEGRSDTLPPELCLRAGVLEALRRFNGQIRVHLVDIDTPATAIRRHLLAIQKQTGAAVRIPDARDIKKRGLRTVEDLERLTSGEQVRRELRTIRHSIRAFQQGFDLGTGNFRFKGSPYLDDREEAISRNIQDVLRNPDCRGVLALYGADHVSKTPRKDGGPKRDRPFSPLALRLEQAGVSVFSLIAFPLSGSSRWRGREGELPWTAADGSLENGEALPQAAFLYIDPKQQRVKLPSQDITRFLVDAFLLFPVATALEDRCAVNRFAVASSREP